MRDTDRYERPVAVAPKRVTKDRVWHEVFDITLVRKGDIIIPDSTIQRYGQVPGGVPRKSVQTSSGTPADKKPNCSADGKPGDETYDLQRELEKKLDELFGSNGTDE